MDAGGRYFLESDSGDITEITADMLVGRSEDCDIVLTQERISRHHAQLSVTDEGVTIEDLRSANGTFVNLERIEAKLLLKDGDTLAFDTLEFRFVWKEVNQPEEINEQTVPLEHTAEFPPNDANVNMQEGEPEPDPEREQKRFALALKSNEEVVQFDLAIFVGRLSRASLADSPVDVDLVLEDSGVSSVHARIWFDESGVWVEDLASRNGTFVNNQKIGEKIRIAHKDCVRFHLTEFIFIDHEAREGTTPEEASFEASDDEGEKGGTVAMPIHRNLPPAWVDDSPSRTQFMQPKDLEPASISRDAERLERLEDVIDGPTLLILSGPESGRPFKLESSSEINFWNIGRSSTKYDLSIVIDDPSISDFHAKLVRRGDRWKIIDQMSTNHTYVNGNQFSTAYLSSKDHIQFGQVETLLILPKTDRERKSKTGKTGLWFRLLNAIGIGRSFSRKDE